MKDPKQAPSSHAPEPKAQAPALPTAAEWEDMVHNFCACDHEEMGYRGPRLHEQQDQSQAHGQ